MPRSSRAPTGSPGSGRASTAGVFLVLSIYLLSLSVRDLPLGLAYAVWVGIGTLGTVAYGTLFLGEPLGALRALCLVMIVAGIVGLKLVGSVQVA